MGESARDEKAALQTTASQNTSTVAPTHEDPLGDQLDIVDRNFLWLDSAAQREIETVRRELKQSDTPSWSEAMIEGVIDVALTAVGARCGAVVVDKLMPKAGEHLPGEFVKKMFEEGLPAGLAASKDELKKLHKSEIDGFVDGYASGVSKLHHENQKHFERHTRHQIASLEQATALADACSEDNLKDAARAQGDACRDAWVTYVAESSFGSMATQEMRDEVNARAPGWFPEQAPSLESAMVGSAAGVLEIGATLPEIRDNQMAGTPEVKIALLNGITEATREEYEGRSLSEMNIPRQLRCSVAGDMPNFSVNINEHGAEVGWLRHAQNEWLRARAIVGKPAGEAHEDSSLADAGLKLLLADLVPESIRGKVI